MKKGFSLVEMLVGLGLFAILGTVSTVMLLSAMRGARKAAAINIVKNEGQYALNAITQTARFARLAECTAGPTLTLTRADDTTAVYSLTGEVITGGGGNLTSTKVTVTECAGGMFACNGRTVQVCFNIDTAGAADVTESVEEVPAAGSGIMFKTSVVLRNWGI